MQQIKRLDIICKTKGLPRPNKEILRNLQGGSASRVGGTYVSPYGRNRGVSPGMSNGSRNNSTNRPNNFAPGAQRNNSQNRA